MPAALAQWAGKLIRIYDWWHLALRKGSRSYGGALLADCGTQARACNNCTATVSTSSASLADGVLFQSSWKKVENNQQVSENTLWLPYLSSVNRLSTVWSRQEPRLIYRLSLENGLVSHLTTMLFSTVRFVQVRLNSLSTVVLRELITI